MNQLMGMLQKRIAGLPAWAWALVIGGTIVGYAYLTRMSDGPKPAPTAPPYPSDDAAADAGDIPGVPVTPPRDIEVTTNPAWIRYVTDRLVAEGFYGAVEVTNALTKVLGGIDVTEQESAIYNVAVRRFGAPPEGAPPIKVIPKPPVVKPPTVPIPRPPRGYGWVKVVRGDSISRLAARSRISVADLRKYNPGEHLNRLTPGEYVKVRHNSNPATHPYAGR